MNISMKEAARVANEALYFAARAARKSGDPSAAAWIKLALESDAIIDGVAK
ncbi:hypothetical protein PE067_09210 [Paracoccus sp. DMF-8]|uniref:hypothetical protein n=1 Tax=Paracoccus sp. DMF-8 TaxID=3019445 RepID=UPI0023E7CF9C|nr:hypothetical protein [Paracoccus sp. DMF-8]MDF3606296.1 hypothetical protein [Paracoccus sp. DMF-8]